MIEPRVASGAFDATRGSVRSGWDGLAETALHILLVVSFSVGVVGFALLTAGVYLLLDTFN